MVKWKHWLAMALLAVYSHAHAEVVTGTGLLSIQLQSADTDTVVVQVDDEGVSGIARVPLDNGVGAAWIDVAVRKGRKPRVNWGRVEVAVMCSEVENGADVAYYRILPNGNEVLRAAVRLPMEHCAMVPDAGSGGF